VLWRCLTACDTLLQHINVCSCAARPCIVLHESPIGNLSRYALCCAVYMTANLSGGHITPTVTIATMITGHITILKGIAYVLAQLVGSIFGSLLIVRRPLPSSQCIRWCAPCFCDVQFVVVFPA